MPKPVRIGLILVVIAAAVGGVWYALKLNGHDPNVIQLYGNIEAVDAQISFQAAGKLVERLVDEGDQVEAGQLIARLDASELSEQAALRQAELAATRAMLAELAAGTRSEKLGQAAAQVAQAQARLDELEHGAREQELAQAANNVAQAEADVARTAAEVDLRQAELTRARQLFAEGVIPQQQLDQAETAGTVAREGLAAAQQRLDSAREAQSLIQEGPREEQVAQARAALDFAQQVYREAAAGPRAETLDQAAAKVAAAERVAELAQVQLGYAELRAPLKGIVLEKSAEVGEYMRPGVPVVTLGDLEHVWLRAYLREEDLGRVKLGQAVEVTTDSYPGKIYAGRISFIANEAEFTPKMVQTQTERVKLVYRVKIEIANDSEELKPGMPADGTIRLAGQE